MENIYKITIGIVIIVFVVIVPLFIKSTDEIVIVKIIDKERVTKQNSSKYLIYTEDEVFENTDTILFLKFNSSDVYSKLDKDKEYELLVYGWRIPLISWYRNIVEIK